MFIPKQELPPKKGDRPREEAQKEPLLERVRVAAETSPAASMAFLRDKLLPEKKDGLRELADDETLVPRDRSIVGVSLARVEGCERVLT